MKIMYRFFHKYCLNLALKTNYKTMKNLIFAVILGTLLICGCENNPVNSVTEVKEKKQINSITITTNTGTKTFDYEKILFYENYLTITIFNELASQDVIYSKDSIIYYETFK